MDNKSIHTDTLLIVDDEAAIRSVLRDFLEIYNYKILEAENGIQAIELFNEHHPDLILLDVQLPELDGISVCRSLRENGNKFIPIIMMTGNDDNQIIDDAFDVGATDYITKPIKLKLLLQRIRFALRNENLRKEMQQSQLQLDEAHSIAKLGHWYMKSNEMVWHFSKNISKLCDFTTFNKQDIEFKTFLNLLNSEDASTLENLICLSIDDKQEREMEFSWSDLEKKENHYISFRWQAIKNELNNLVELRGICQDITDRKNAEETIERQIYYDQLTNLPNRRLLTEIINRCVIETDNNNNLMAILFIDCDRFKPINDSLGHPVGDELLRSIANRLKECVRTTDTVCRVSGDEFAILLENISNIAEIDTVAQKLVNIIAEPHIVKGHKVFTSVSIGVSVYPFENITCKDLLSFADIAMFHAKQKGGNQFQYYDSGMNSKNTARLHLEQDLREALDRDELHLYYQPQNHIDDMQLMSGVEVLLRWHHSKKGIVSPVDFIPIAEETGMIVAIGEWVILKACEQAVQWNEQGYGIISVGINLSPRQFNQSNLVDVVKNAIKITGVRPEQLDFEITESISMQNINTTIQTLNKLKELGVNISLDDFGTGYSSLSYLQQMPIDTLKIDRAFIRNIHESEKDRVFVKTIISMAHSLGMNVIAEGVENCEQFNFLREHGCEIAQGFLFSPPVIPEKLLPFLVSLKENIPLDKKINFLKTIEK